MSSIASDMNRFLASVEKKAFKMANFALSNTDDALDIVQESMFALAKKYAKRPQEQWQGLFFKILQNRIRDRYRRRNTHNRVFAFFQGSTVADEDSIDVAQLHPGRESDQPERRSQIDAAGEQLQKAITALPLRQQQAFLLRSWEGLSVKEASKAMSCSQPSVKTHYSRAIAKLRESLGEHWP